MKHLLKNLAASKGRFRLRADVDAEDGLTGTAKEGTGSLKLMTVFIAVLVLHIVGIGSYTAYHYLKGPSKDAAQSEANAPEAVSPDGTAPDKTVADGTTPAPADAAAPAAPGTETADAGAAAPSVQTADGASPVPAAPVAAPGQPVVPGAVKAAAPIAPAPAVVANIPAAPAAAISGGAYVVKSGDTLHKIAATHGMTVAKLKELNGLKSDMLHIGQKLAVGASVPASAPAPAIASAPAPAAAIAPASAPAVAAAGHSYTVVKGDTLTKIAKSFGTSPAAIMAANKLSDPKKLKIGQALMIPSKAGDRREVSEQQAAPAPLQPQANPDLVMNK